MKSFSILVLLFFIPITKCFGQKPAIDTLALEEWIKVENGAISSDGKFVSYNIIHTKRISGIQQETVILACSGKWKKYFNTATTSITFSPDSKVACLILSNDTLAILKPGTDNISYILGVSSFQIIPGYLLCTSSADPKKLSLIGISDKHTTVLDGIVQYQYDDNNDALILLKQGSNDRHIFSYYSLNGRINYDFWEGEDMVGYYFDHITGKFALIGKTTRGERGIWIYHPGEGKAFWLMSENDLGIDSSNTIVSVHGFSKNGDKLLVAVQPRKINNKIEKLKDAANVTIWSYTDARLKSQDERNAKEIPTYIYAIDLTSKAVIHINEKYDKINDISNDFAIVRQFSGRGDMQEKDWNPKSQFKTLIISLKDGKRSELPFANPITSKAGHFLLYFDPISNDYCTYSLATDSIINVTHSITSSSIGTKTPFYKNEFTSDWDYQSYWMGEEDSAVILYAERDIWQVDPIGKRTPINITNGYGAKNNIVFYPVGEFSSFKFKKGEELLLVGYNFSNKKNGFYKIRWGIREDPKELVMNDYVYCNPHVLIHNGYDNYPMKATNANVWLIRRMSERESPNYFVTKDFKSFAPVSNVYPEKKYNWVSGELHTWKSFDGDSIQGILYKPENFSPSTKYPIIFYYYEQFSNNLHSYFVPEAFIGPLNIPYMVSQGYLVFATDIHYKPGETGMSAYNSVVSAAMYMAKKPYVDSTKMGIQGHSFGGYETNFIITQTGIFAAACSASGVTDLISLSGGISSQGKSMHWMTDKGQIRLNVKLWKDPQRYMDNSPLFFLDKVTTPLLIMHTTDDKAVPFSQALELFNALRQFRKKVWMLIYRGEDHVLRNKRNAYDYTERQIQFFDFYLRGKEMPAWMSPTE